MSAPSSVTHSREDLEKAADHIFSHVVGLFSYYVWVIRIAPFIDERGILQTKGGSYCLPMVSATLVDGVLINLRRLDEFFSTQKKNPKYPDDLRAYDFGFESAGRFLPTEDSLWIHKLVAHPTIKISKRGIQTFNPSELAEKALTHCFAFLDFLEKTFYGETSVKGKQMQRVTKMIKDLHQEWRIAIEEKARENAPEMKRIDHETESGP